MSKKIEKMHKTAVNVKRFGAGGNSDDTNALQACFDYCRDHALNWVIPAGRYYVPTGKVTAYTSGVCHGEIISENATTSQPVFEIASKPEDVESVTPSTVSAWGDLVKNQSNIAAATGLKDWYYFLQTSAPWIVRIGSGGTFNKYHAFRFTTNSGDITPHAKTDVSQSAVVSVLRKRIRERVTVKGVRVSFTTGTGEREGAILVTRPNTQIISCAVDNQTSTPVMQGFYTANTCMIEHVLCESKGMGVNATNYAYAGGGWSFDVNYLHCRESDSRRGIDVQNGQDIAVTGGAFPSGVGGHWVHGLTLSAGAVIGATSAANPNPVHMAGGDLSVSGCTLVAKSGAAFVNMREDLPEIGGSVILDNNTYVLDDANASRTEYSIVDLSFGSASGYLPGRQMKMPSIITIKGGTFTLNRSGDATATFDLYAIKAAWADTAAKSTNGAEYDTIASIEALSCDFGSLTDFRSSDSRPRLSVLYNKGYGVSGRGLTFNVSDVKSIRVFSSAAAANVDTPEKRTAARADYYFRNVETVFAAVADGVARRAFCENVDTYSRSKPSGTAGFIAVGDEAVLGQTVLHIDVKVASVLTMPPVATGRICFVTNDAGGAVLAYCDGVAWRRSTDRAVIASA